MSWSYISTLLVSRLVRSQVIGGFRSYVVRACEVFWVFRVWELDLVNVCGEIPCNRRWLLKPSSSPPRWFFWPAETRTEDNVSVWTTGKERGSERSYKSHYNAEKPCTHTPTPTPRHVCVCEVFLSNTLSICVCACTFSSLSGGKPSSCSSTEM